MVVNDVGVLKFVYTRIKMGLVIYYSDCLFLKVKYIKTKMIVLNYFYDIVFFTSLSLFGSFKK
jgi:hypothetical protein